MNLACTSRHIYNIKSSSHLKPTTASLLVFLPLNKTDQKIIWKTCREAQISSFSEGHELYMYSEQLELLALTRLSNNFDSVCELIS